METLPLPKSAQLLSLFEAGHPRRTGDQEPLSVVSVLAQHHNAQWDVETISRDPKSEDRTVAESKRTLDRMNSKRADMIAELDHWWATWNPFDVDQEIPLHTESFGSLVDRLAIAWVRARKMSSGEMLDSDEIAATALLQLEQLANAYDGLVGEIAANKRRLPHWRPLKSYRKN